VQPIKLKIERIWKFGTGQGS